MNVRSYIVALMIGCAVGGLTLFVGLSHVNSRVELSSQVLNESSLALRDVSRLEDGFSQWLLLSDLIIGSNQTYLIDGANNIEGRLTALLGQLARQPQESPRAELAELFRFVKRQRERLKLAGSYMAADRPEKMDQCLADMDEESMRAIDALEQLKDFGAGRVQLLESQHQGVLAWRNRTVSIMACAYIAFVILLWFWISNIISRPLRQLTYAARTALDDNQEFQFHPVGPAEVHHLTESFTRLVASLERRVNERTQHLRRLNQELEASAGRARAADVAKSEFLANISHEIRTPMTAIIGFAENLLESNRPTESSKDQADAITTIIRNGEHLLRLINDILDLSKIECGKLEMESIPVSPFELVNDVVELMAVKAEARGVDLKAEFPDQGPRSILSDTTRLRQILVNLVGNAVKFTRDGQVRVVVRAERRTDGEGSSADMHFEVIDSGVGMTSEQCERIFNAFTQADTSMSRRFGGTGLGLTISRHLAQLLGGDISVKSRVGQGSTFKLSVVVGLDPNVEWVEYGVDSKSAVRRQPASPKRVDLTGLGSRVLLVEDGPDNQRLISFILKKAGVDVTVCENGQLGYEEAIRQWRQQTPYDVILMDMQMPVLDGYQATALLREEGYNGPIIALTAHAMSHDRQKCLDAGCNAYSAKPVDRGELLAIIAEYAQSAAERRSNENASPQLAEG